MKGCAIRMDLQMLHHCSLAQPCSLHIAANPRKSVCASCLARHPRLELGPTTGAESPRFGARRGGRVVECTALEMRHRCKPIGGSNPSLSASKSLILQQDIFLAQLCRHFRRLAPAIARVGSLRERISRALRVQCRSFLRTRLRQWLLCGMMMLIT